MTKTKTQTKCLKNPTYAIFLKSWWLTHSKYDDRYLTLVILFTPVTLVTLFRSYNQFYRAECITASGFFVSLCVQSPRPPLALKGWEEGRELHLIFSLRHSAIVAIRLPLFLDLLHTLSGSSCATHNSNLWQKYGFSGAQAQTSYLSLVILVTNMRSDHRARKIVPSCHPGWENIE